MSSAYLVSVRAMKSWVLIVPRCLLHPAEAIA